MVLECRTTGFRVMKALSDQSPVSPRQCPWLRMKSKMDAARLEFMALRYANGTLDTKDSSFKTWCEIAAARGLEPLPVTTDKLVEISAVLRASGYRSGLAYILEAKQRHLRHGFAWREHLDVVIKDCNRAFLRAIGPARKAVK